MGIRFFCANGHRLHVKSFLAGKRGVCPDCGLRVEIPMQSDARAMSSKRKTANGESLPDDALHDDDHATTAVLDGPETDITGGDASSIHSIDTDLNGSVAASSLTSNGTKSAPANGRAHSSASAVSLAKPKEPVERSPANKLEVSPTLPIPNGKIVVASSEMTSVAPSPTIPCAPSPPTPAPPDIENALPDPIAEMPAAIWYVRPPGGGQYGPAKGDVFRKWITEGRVTADSLVWREDWPDWRGAAKVLPSFAAAASASATPGPVVADTPRRPSRASRKPSKISGVGIVVVLALVCVALFGALIYVVMNTGSTPPVTP